MSASELNLRFGDALISRNGAGISVSLYFDRELSECYVAYRDCATDLEFVLNPPKFLALEAYKHPLYYMRGAMQGKDNPANLVPASAVL